MLRRFDELVFPQVDELSRDQPLVLPLGETADLPQEGLLLPAIPFGFELPSFGRLLDSIVATLREDGFQHIEVVRGTASRTPAAGPVLVPVGHVEQHGFHLPLATDTIIAEALARRVEELCDVRPLPVWPYGVSTHRRQFPGTLSADPRAWEDFWVELVGQLRDEGSRCVYFLNGHGGNHSFLANVVKFTGERWPDMLVATTFLHTASGKALRLLEELRDSTVMGHACELETSYLLYLRPDLCHMEWVVDEPDFVATSNYGMDWMGEGALLMNPPWTDDTRTGSYGSPSVATAEKGRRWLEAAVAEIALHLEEMHEQLRRREERRRNGWVEGAWRSLWAAR